MRPWQPQVRTDDLAVYERVSKFLGVKLLAFAFWMDADLLDLVETQRSVRRWVRATTRMK